MCVALLELKMHLNEKTARFMIDLWANNIWYPGDSFTQQEIEKYERKRKLNIASA